MQLSRSLLGSALTTAALLLECSALGRADGGCDPVDHVHWIGEHQPGFNEGFFGTNVELTDRFACIAGYYEQFPDLYYRSDRLDLTDPNHPVRLGGIPAVAGRVNSFAATEDYLFVGSVEPDGPGAAVASYSVSPSGVLTQLDVIYLPFGVGVVASGDLLFLSYDGVTVVDASDPGNLTVVGSASVENEGMLAESDLVYVASSTGFSILDVQTPSSPTVIGTWVGPEVNRLAKEGDLIYALTDAGLEIVDVSVPVAPTSIGSYALPSTVSLAVVSGQVYVGTTPDGVVILDASDPGSIVEVGIMNTQNRVWDMDTNQSLICMTGATFDHQFYGSADLAPAEPVASLDTGIAEDVMVQDGVAYVLDRTNGFVTVDVSDPLVPAPLGNVSTGRLTLIGLEGVHAYVTDSTNNELLAIDITDPALPQVVGSVAGLGTAKDLRVRGDYIFVTTTSGLVVLSRAIPDAPAILTTVPTVHSGWALAIELYGDYAYVGGSEVEMIEVFDVSNPASPVSLGSFDAPAGDLLVHEANLCVSFNGTYDEEGGTVGSFLDVYSLADPVSPSFTATMRIPEGVYGVPPRIAADGSTVYYAGGLHGVLHFDLSDPADPRPQGQIASVDETWGVDPQGEYVYAACGAQGLVVLRAPCGATTAVPFAGAERGSLIRVSPNPSFGRATITLASSSDQSLGVQIFDAGGRLVRELSSADAATKPQEFEWNGDDESGLAVPAGVYFARRAGGGSASAKIQIVR